MYRNTKKGFTLIELLVVIAIIGVLSSVVLASLNSAREKGRRAKARAEIIQIVDAVEIARGEKNQTLRQITGSGCTRCSGTVVALQASLKKIADAAGVFEGLERIGPDPWGSFYYLDENENEFGSTDCRRDTLNPGGNSDQSVAYRLSFYTDYCNQNPDSGQGDAGWRATF